MNARASNNLLSQLLQKRRRELVCAVLKFKLPGWPACCITGQILASLRLLTQTPVVPLPFKLDSDLGHRLGGCTICAVKIYASATGAVNLSGVSTACQRLWPSGESDLFTVFVTESTTYRDKVYSHLQCPLQGKHVLNTCPAPVRGRWGHIWAVLRQQHNHLSGMTTGRV